MKKLILVRHAKSDWPENTEDIDRPLAESGVDEAQKMSEFLKTRGLEFDKLISSPAKRALKTCEIFNEIFETDSTINSKLYNPSENNFLSVIYDLDDSDTSIAMFSHNNGISNFANYLTEGLFHFPTCGVAGFEINCNKWSDFDAADKKMIFFYEPQNI
ncbi:SixA phosphatase family protein [Amniculibacterium aquaticum]|uniref:SixA phosphatase family protein n=1 Tax=Amniculibacterium aquaticum TaxID=2479858 RepID=UPI000F596F3A|nr:histidine phosphatase family protein [Amniculibacterium aquaticum]